MLDPYDVPYDPTIPLDTSAFELVDPHAEVVAVKINPSSHPIDVICVYIPPASSRALPRGYIPNVHALLAITNDDALILGDLNAHSGAWHSSLSDRRGEAIAAAVVHQPFFFLNLDCPTRKARDETKSSPDVSIASASLVSSVDLSVHTKLNSDHLPILVNFLDNFLPRRDRETYVNFCKADWPRFTAELDDLVSQLPPPAGCSSGERLLRDAIKTASKHSIPAGFRRDFKPEFPREAVDVAAERDRSRSSTPNDPRIEQLNLEISNLVSANKQRVWREKVCSANPRQNSAAYFSLMRRLQGKQSSVPRNQPVSFRGVPISDQF